MALLVVVVVIVDLLMVLLVLLLIPESSLISLSPHAWEVKKGLGPCMSSHPLLELP